LKTKQLAQHGFSQYRLTVRWCEISFPKLFHWFRFWPVRLMQIYWYCWSLSTFQSLHRRAKSGQAGLLYGDEIYTQSSLCLERGLNSPKAPGWNGSQRCCGNLYTL